MPFRPQLAPGDRLAELAFGEQWIISELRIHGAKLRDPDGGRQVEGRVVLGVGRQLALDEGLGDDELVLGDESRPRYSAEPVNGCPQRFVRIG